MTGSQSIESAKAIARLEQAVHDLEGQLDRRCNDLKEDITGVKNAQWWFFGVVVAGMVTLIISFAAGVLGG